MTSENQNGESTPETENEVFNGSYADLNLDDELQKALTDMKYLKPTEVQYAVYPIAMEKRDLIVQSRTGSGKTTAFSMPVVAQLDKNEQQTQALILCPTRELASQVAREIGQLSKPKKLKVESVYGGTSVQKQIEGLEKAPHIVVGTPGRVLDMIRRGHLKTKNMSHFVLDEADEMLSMGFWDDVTAIWQQLPKKHQKMLFSATVPPAVERTARSYLSDPQRIDLSTDTLNVETIEHIYHKSDEKIPHHRDFLYLIEVYRPSHAIVFCNRRDETELITRYLQRFGFRAAALNGDMSQNAREKVLKKVRNGELDLMIATDVAARGIDISELSHIFNYDLPDNDEVYIHRAGRTGRNGKEGKAISLIRGKSFSHLTTLQNQFEVPFIEAPSLPEKEIIMLQAERIAKQLAEDAEGVEIAQYIPAAEAILERDNKQDLFAFLLRSHFRAQKKVTESHSRGDSKRSERPERKAKESRKSVKAELKVKEHNADDAQTKIETKTQTIENPEKVAKKQTEKPERTERAPKELSPQVNLYITLGKDDNFDDLLMMIDFVAERADVDPGHFTGEGSLRDHSSHLEVDREVHEQICSVIHESLRPGTDQDHVEAYKVYREKKDAARAAREAGEGFDESILEVQMRSPFIKCEVARPKRRYNNSRRGNYRGKPQNRRPR